MFELSLSNWPQASKLLDRGIDVSPLLNNIAETILTSIDRRFEAEESAEGKPWVASHRATQEGGQTLSDSGKFRRSFAYDAQGDHIKIGTNWPWANTHHYGVKIKPLSGKYLAFNGIFVKEVNIPARPVLGFSDSDKKIIEVQINNHIKDRLGALV